MNYIRLKTNLREACIRNRLQYDPEIVEFYLDEKDLDHPELLVRQIRRLQQSGIQVYLHHPSKYRGRYLDIMEDEPQMRRFYLSSSKMLADICKRENIRCVVHAHYVDTYSSSRTDLENTLKMKHRILEILDFCGDCFLWEDTIGGLFSYANPHLLPHLVKPLNLPLNVDISHAFISFGGDNDRLEETLRLTRPYARYYHVVDSCGEHHDSLPLGKGKIDWRRVIPYVEDRPFIFEITLPGDHTDCTLMIESARTFTEIRNSLHHSRL